MSTPVIYEEAGGIGRITLNRPEKLNAIDDRCLDLIGEHIATANDSPGVGAIVVAGNGRHFCAGADLSTVELHVDAGTFGAFLTRWHTTFGAVDTSGKPTVAAVHGLAMAGGFELTQVCDLVILEADGAVADGHSKLGLFPGGGSTQRLPRMIGRRRAMWMLLSGGRCDPATAMEWGLANEIVPAGTARDRAEAVARQLAGMSRSTNRAIKAAVVGGASLDLDDALQLERSLAVTHMSSNDARAGMNAFARNQEPEFADP